MFEVSRAKAVDKLNHFVENNLLEYSERLFSTKLFNWSKALALEASNFILIYFDFFFLRPNLSLCLSLKITIALAIKTIAIAS